MGGRKNATARGGYLALTKTSMSPCLTICTSIADEVCSSSSMRRQRTGLCRRAISYPLTRSSNVTPRNLSTSFSSRSHISCVASLSVVILVFVPLFSVLMSPTAVPPILFGVSPASARGLRLPQAVRLQLEAVYLPILHAQPGPVTRGRRSCLCTPSLVSDYPCF